MHVWQKISAGSVIGLAVLLLVNGAQARSGLAHERFVQSGYAFVLGWLEEPPLAGLKNAALLELSTADTAQPVEGAEATLTAHIVLGGKSKELILRPLAGHPGTYVGDFIPTRRGTYTLRLGGTVNGQPIDLSGDIEEVGSSDSLAFPEPLGADTQQALSALQAEIGGTRALALAGAALGVSGLVLAGVGLGRRRR